MTSFAAVEFEVVPLEGHTLDCTSDLEWLIIDNETGRRHCTLTAQAISEVTMKVSSLNGGVGLHGFGKCWTLHAATGLHLRSVVS